MATNRPSSFLKKDKILAFGLAGALTFLAGVVFFALAFAFAVVAGFGCFEPLEDRGGIVLVAMGGNRVVGIVGGGLVEGVVAVVFGGDGGLPTDGSTCVPDDTEMFSRGFRNIEEGAFLLNRPVPRQKSLMTPCRGRVKARRLILVS